LQDFYDICQKKQTKEIDVSWEDIAIRFGYKDSESARQKWKRYRKNNNISKTIDNKLDGINNLLGSDRLLIQKIREEKRQLESYKSDLGRTLVLAEYIKEALENLNIHKRSPYKEIISINNSKVGIIQLSDTHDGIIIKPSHTNGFNKYNPQIMTDRLYKYLEEIVIYGRMYNIKKVYVFGLADYIEHDSMRSNQLASIAFPIVEQMMHFEEVLYNWLVDLSKYFIVEFDGVGGNHDRNNGDKKKEIKENNLSSLLLHMTKLRLGNNHPNIIYNYEFNKQVIVKNILGYWILGKHGHEDGGNKIDRMRDNVFMDGKDINYFLYGHLHNFKVETGSRGKKAIGNGSVMGANDFARTSLHSNTNASQNLLILEESKGIIGYHEIDLQ
jgi:hypothetical protein